jgi:DNA sulfur modification protein DndD
VKLLSVHISNFKLLEDIKLSFSVDPKRPLTVVRAENGSGKTSLLYALQWGFFGSRGLPAEAQNLRLISSACETGKPVTVQVMIEFEHTDEAGISTRYRLVRTKMQTPRADDVVDQGAEKLRLLRISDQGETEVDAALIDKLLPLRLKDVFFTNGEDVQSFIAGSGSVDQRQGQVHNTIRALLGLDALELASLDLEHVVKKFRAEAAKSAGVDVEKANSELVRIEEAISELQEETSRISEQLSGMRNRKTAWEKELNQLRGIGDLDALNDQIKSLETDLVGLERDRTRTLLAMRDLIRSEEFSWSFLGESLNQGVNLLHDLSDRNVIPGVSIEVLSDRLSLGECICGASLVEGVAENEQRREHVCELIEGQRKNTESAERLTGIWHLARQSQAVHIAQDEEGLDFLSKRSDLLGRYTSLRDAITSKGIALSSAKERRHKIDDDRVRELTESITKVDAQIGLAEQRLGQNGERIGVSVEEKELKKKAVDEVQSMNDKSSVLTMKKAVAEDFHTLAKGTLSVLEGDYVKRVSTRMSELFMQIVGSHPDFEAGVFTGAHIAENFDIVVDTHNDRRLDPSFELNGASQRALTLAFIWSLMEISATTAPRIIDTPLGYTAGGVKTRMVETITRPAKEGMPDFQVILLLTRSEVRDIDELLDQRAGRVITMSCSKDFPEDLRISWNVDHPVIRTCGCSHRQSCRTCARHYDDQHGVVFSDVDVSV